MLWHAADQKQHLLDLVEEQSPWEWFTGAEEPTADLDYSYEGLDDIWLEPDEACQALDAEVELFWRVVADRYADRDNVVFDLYDRPAGPFAGDWGGAERPRGALQLRPGAERFELTKEYAKPYYDLWRERSQSWVLEAEDNGQGQLLVLGSPQYSQYTYWAPYNEHDAENVCYSASVQLQDSLRPLEHVVGCPSEYVPVFVTNVGWQDFTLTVPKPWLDRDLPGIDWATGDADPTGGYSFSRFFDEADVHPICATFDHTREPIFFEHGDPSVAGGGARGSDHWYDDGYLLEEATPGGWWQEFVNARETHVSSGDEPYPDADPGPNSLHGLDPVPAGSAGPYGDHDPAVDDGPTPGCLSSDGGDPDDRQGPTCAGQPVNATATVDGRTVCDVDGDELYRDVNADGEVTQTDVVEFFRVQHREAWKRPELFDFSGNDAVDHGDVVALFEHVSAQGL